MENIILSIVLSLVASFIYDSIKNFAKRKPTAHDTSEYTHQYLRNIKFEFYISLPVGIILLLVAAKCPESMYVFTLASAFFMFSLSLMAFICLVEIVNNLTYDDSDNNLK